jgi:hypothetical protein
MTTNKSMYDVAFEQGYKAYQSLSKSERASADSRHYNFYNDGQPLNCDVSYEELSIQFSDGWFEAQCELAQLREDRFNNQF